MTNNKEADAEDRKRCEEALRGLAKKADLYMGIIQEEWKLFREALDYSGGPFIIKNNLAYRL